METAAELQQSEEHRVFLVPVDKIGPSPANPRNFKGKEVEAGLRELAKSIESAGLHEPILVRPVDSGNGATHQIVFGERRWRACKLVKRTEIEAMIRELTDREANQMTTIENLQREDLTPIEESNGVQTLLNTGLEVEIIADKLGKSVRWVQRRARLRNLTAKWKKAIADPDDLRYFWSPSHLELIVRFDKKIQDELADELAGYSYVMSLKDVKNRIDSFQMKLSGAPWKLDDKDVSPKAGACSACKKRSSRQLVLFDEDEQVSDKNDRCLDKNCWVDKMERMLELKRKKMTRQYDNFVLVDRSSWKYADPVPKESQLRKDAVELSRSDEAKKSDNGAVPALIVNGPGAGTMMWVKGDSVSAGSVTVGPDGEKVSTPLAERRKVYAKRRTVRYIETVQGILDEEIKDGEKYTNELDSGQIMCAARVFGVWSYGKVFWKKHGEPAGDDCDLYKNELSKLQGSDAPDEYRTLELKIMKQVYPIWKENLQSELNNYVGPTDKLPDMICEFLGADAAEIKAQILADIPDAKSWAKLNEDGTEKKKGAKKQIDKVLKKEIAAA